MFLNSTLNMLINFFKIVFMCVNMHSYFFFTLEESFFVRDFFPSKALSRNSSSIALFTVLVIIFFSLCASCSFAFLGCTGASISQKQYISLVLILAQRLEIKFNRLLFTYFHVFERRGLSCFC